MYRLYLDTCILNDAFPLAQNDLGGSVRQIDVKVPIFEWAEEYLALYHLLDRDDQWELEFGTSEVTLQEIGNFRPHSERAREKKSFLEDIAETLYEQFRDKCKIESGPVIPGLNEYVVNVLGPGNDALHVCQAIQGRYDFFITTDFNTILNHREELEELIVKTHGYQAELWSSTWQPIREKVGMRVRSPLQFLEENLIPLPTLIRTLHGSWTDPDELIAQSGQALLDLSRC